MATLVENLRKRLVHNFIEHKGKDGQFVKLYGEMFRVKLEDLLCVHCAPRIPRPLQQFVFHGLKSELLGRQGGKEWREM